jgi:hypothetical protein
MTVTFMPPEACNGYVPILKENEKVSSGWDTHTRTVEDAIVSEENIFSNCNMHVYVYITVEKKFGTVV